MPRSSPRRLLGIAAVILVAMALVAGAIAWFLRDLPRRKVQSALAQSLGADVELGRLVVEGARRFVLHDLVVTRMMAWNRLQRLKIGRLVVAGSAKEILALRFESLDASAVEIVVGPPDPSIAQPPQPPEPAFIDRFRLADARVTLELPFVRGTAEVEADLTGFGGDLTGVVRARCDRLDVNLGDANGVVRALAGRAEFAEGASSVTALARAAAVELTRGEQTVTIARPEAGLDLARPENGGATGFNARAKMPGVEAIAAKGTIDAQSSRVIAADAAVRGIDVATWLPLIPGVPEDAKAAGRIDATAAFAQGAPLRWTAHTQLDVLDVPAGSSPSQRIHAQGVDLALQGELDATHPAQGGPVHARLIVPVLRGTVVNREIPTSLSPVAATFDGRIAAGKEAAIAGHLSLENGLTGALAAEIETEDLTRRPALAARWTLGPTSLHELLPVARANGAPVPDGVDVHGTLRAQGEVAWPAAHGRILQARVSVDGLGVATARQSRLEQASLAATLRWPTMDAPIAVSGIRLEGELEARPVPKLPLVLVGDASVEPFAPAIRTSRFAISSTDLFEADTSGAWSPAAGGTFAVKVGSVDLQRWQAFLRPWIGDPAPGFAAKGSLSADVSGTISRDWEWAGSGHAAIAKSGFSSDDGARVLDGLDTSWAVTLSGRDLFSGSARATAKVAGFQLLWDSFFADFTALPSNVDVEAAFDASGPGDPDWSGSLAWRYPDGPTLDLHAKGRGSDSTTFDGVFTVDDLGKTLATYLRAPLGDTIPWFTRIEGGGALSLRAGGSIADDAIELAGSVRVKDGRIEGTDGFVEVNGLELDLPYDLRWSPPNAEGRRSLAGRPQSGSLGFRKLDVGGMSVAETATTLRVEADTLALDESVAIPVLGGTVGFEKLTLIELLRPSRRAETAILVFDVQLKDAAVAFGLPPLDGAANGYFPGVTLQGSTIEVNGGGGISVFGGVVKIGNVSGEDVLTRFPKIRLSADFESIDLEKVTSTFDVGAMSGIVRGYVHDLELFRGVPTRFSARVETTPTKGVSNKVNVKAVNNIAIIGTGGGNVLNRGIQRFIDEFTYDRLGIELTLVNDVFLIRGLEHRGDRELFLKGRFPFPIDVVNAQPGRTVSFRSMLERLRAIDFAAATTH